MKITIELPETVAQALRTHWTQQPIENVIAALAIMEATGLEDLTANCAVMHTTLAIMEDAQ